MTTANIMQLLNFAVECMEPGEVYCEIGTLRGATLIGALLDHPNSMAYAVDDFSEFDDFGENIDKLSENLSLFNLEDNINFCHQNFEDFFRELSALNLEDTIGVFFYDADISYRSQLLALLLVKPFLSSQAILILTDTHEKETQQAILDFIASHPQCKLELYLDTPNNFCQSFGQGIFILSWNINKISIIHKTVEHFEVKSLKNNLKNPQANTRDKALNFLFKDAALLTHSQRYTEAEQQYKTFLLYKGNHAHAWMNLGIIYYLTKKYQQALSALSKSRELDPSNSALYYNFGLVFETISNYQQAIDAYRQAIVLNPQHIDAYNNLGNILLQTGQVQESEAVYRQAIKESPNNFSSHQNLGNALMATQQWDKAIETYEKALDLKPRDPDIMNNLALAHEARGERALSLSYLAYSCYRQRHFEEAVRYFKQVLEINQGVEPADYLALGDCLSELNQEEESLSILNEGLKRYPDVAGLYFAAISLLQTSGRTQEAIAVASQAVIIHPDNLLFYFLNKLLLPICYDTPEEITFYRQQYIQGLQDVIQRTNLDSFEAKKSALAAVRKYTTIFYLSFQDYNNRDLHKQYGDFLHKVVSANYRSLVAPRRMPPVGEHGKIRIGYLSEQLGNSSAAKWMLGWLQESNKDKFEIYCYRTSSYLDSDSTTQKIRTLTDFFYDLPDNLEAISEQIIKDQLHILVFLAIGLHPHTTQLASLCLAPIQCAAWGHPVTTGLPTIDYFLSGNLLEPENAQEHYTEHLVRLPNLGISYPKPLIREITKTRADFQLADDAVIYLSCQSGFKYLPQYDYLFVEIARYVPKAQFVFVFRSKIFLNSSKTVENKFRQRLHKAFTAAQLNSEDYCVFLPAQNWDGYTSLLLNSDVFLDTLSFSGGHTSFDAVACNLPIVTCPGQFMRGRQSYGILKMLGVTDTIAQNEAEYIEIAVRLGLDPEWRREISHQMNERHADLFEDKTCVKALEQFYEQVVQERLKQQESTTLTLPNISATKTVLHVGCGPETPGNLPETFCTEEWQELRLDIDPAVRPDIIGSITEMSAVPNESVDAVYSSHNLEHIYHYQVPIALAEFKRVLKLGGFALIVVPDMQVAAEYVARGDMEKTPLYISPAGPVPAIMMFYGLGTLIPDEPYMAHRTGFTAESIGDKMQEAGFRDLQVCRENFNIVVVGYK
ncbi:tetratricopeptide repeat protein [Microcoleus sp. herbarium12]|uniref:tetratricopeptide repeat protein n=1 Tax=Microcoleus sp. herbarium12 TaxID=3055437 RepID=UPI002FD1A4D8